MRKNLLFFAVIALVFFPETRGAMGSAARRAASTAAQRYLQTTPELLAPLASTPLPPTADPKTQVKPVPSYQAPASSFASPAAGRNPASGQPWRKTSSNGARYFSSRRSSSTVTPEGALESAIQLGNLEKVKQVLKRYTWSQKALDDALYTATIFDGKNAVAIMEALVNAGANINAKHGWDRTPLHEAAGNNSPAVVKFLLSKGADTHALDDQGRWPLYLAQHNPIQSADNTMVIHLLTSRTSPSIQEQVTPEGALNSAIKLDNLENVEQVLKRYTWSQKALDDALYTATIFDGKHAVAIMKALLNAGADINAKHGWDRTSLHEAAGNNSPAVVKFLLENGADTHALDDQGRSPLYLAQHSSIKSADNRAVVHLLMPRTEPFIQEQVKPGGALNSAIKLDNLENVKQVLKRYKWRPKVLDDELYTATLFDGKHAVAIIEALLQAGANINAKHGWGRTSLHEAAGNNSPAVVKFLLENGADTHALDDQGRSPLYLAQHSSIKSADNAMVIHLLESTSPSDNPTTQAQTQKEEAHRSWLAKKLAEIRAWWYRSGK